MSAYQWSKYSAREPGSGGCIRPVSRGKGSGPPRVEEAMRVEIWSDVVCPWCYLGRRHLELALEGFPHRGEVDLLYRSFELDPASPPGVSTPTVEKLARKYGRSVAQAHDAQRPRELRPS